MKRAPRQTKRERKATDLEEARRAAQAQLDRARAVALAEGSLPVGEDTGWRDYTERQGEPWLAVLRKLPSEWVDRTKGILLVPTWLCVIIDAWGEETFGDIDPEALKTAVSRHGPAVAGFLLAKLAQKFDREGSLPAP